MKSSERQSHIIILKTTPLRICKMHFNRRIIFFEVEPKDMHVKNTVPFLNTAKFDNWSTSPRSLCCVSQFGATSPKQDQAPARIKLLTWFLRPRSDGSSVLANVSVVLLMNARQG
uniref:Uncharacterized protein n=1 Tax=Rousettus aegyptiacus TaxID=9407 RepID=A0A7J8B9T8_ROUAE|nr:hypothetical protein HJG63_009978 [Rousettus aegyptiacus]